MRNICLYNELVYYSLNVYREKREIMSTQRKRRKEQTIFREKLT
jgi:hypothetical protein